jgi:hypothetical protein
MLIDLHNALDYTNYGILKGLHMYCMCYLKEILTTNSRTIGTKSNHCPGN